jgi:chromosome segregation ATPase
LYKSSCNSSITATRNYYQYRIKKMALSQDIKDRIFAAADTLYAASQTGEFPKIEAVRQESRAGMNYVVEAMKEWRQKQRKQVQTVREPLPVELHAVVQDMGQKFWEIAQQLANTSLEAAKVAFEAEKQDLMQLSAEQSESFEKQASELEALKARIVELEQQVDVSMSAAQVSALQLEEVREALLLAEQSAALSSQKIDALEHRAAELRAEISNLRLERDKAQQRQEQAIDENAKLAATLIAAQGEAEQVRMLLAGVQAKAEATEQAYVNQTTLLIKAENERESAIQAAGEARERAAGLAGQLEATKQLAESLLVRLDSLSPQAALPFRS